MPTPKSTTKPDSPLARPEPKVAGADEDASNPEKLVLPDDNSFMTEPRIATPAAERRLTGVDGPRNRRGDGV